MFQMKGDEVEGGYEPRPLYGLFHENGESRLLVQSLDGIKGNTG
jgi:hypothetical protein